MNWRQRLEAAGNWLQLFGVLLIFGGVSYVTLVAAFNGFYQIALICGVGAIVMVGPIVGFIRIFRYR